MTIETSAMRFRGERRPVVVLSGDHFTRDAAAAEARARDEHAALVFGLAPAGDRVALETFGWEAVGEVPTLARRLRLLGLVPLVVPFAGAPRFGFREVTDLPADVRITRLWDRFSVDIGFALERVTKLFAWRVHQRLREQGTRVFVFEDGDRYAIRALCIFNVQNVDGRRVGHVLELLHDRSVTGMRAASHLLGLATRAMSDDGAETVRALALPHSGSYPIFAMHAFFPSAAVPAQQLMVKTLDEDVDDSVVLRDRWYVSFVDALAP